MELDLGHFARLVDSKDEGLTFVLWDLHIFCVANLLITSLMCLGSL